MKNFIYVILASAIMAGCSSISVTTDYDKTADFNSFKTYSFFEWQEESDKLLTRFDKERIKNSVGEELEARGYKFVEGEADLTVSLYLLFWNKKLAEALIPVIMEEDLVAMMIGITVMLGVGEVV